MAITIPTEDIKRKKIFDAMAGSLGKTAPEAPVSTTTPPAPPLMTSRALPTASPIDMNVAGPAAPTFEPGPSTPTRVGYSAKGISGLDRDILLKKAQQESDPTSKVSVQGDFIDIAPPNASHGKGFMGRLKSIGRGALTGLAMADPSNPNAILGSAIGGGALGGFDPHSEAALKRKFDIRKTDSDIERGLKLEQEQTQLGGMKEQQRQQTGAPTKREEFDRETQLANEKLRIEDDRIKGLISDQEADRRQRVAEMKSRETEGEKDRGSRETVAGMRTDAKDPANAAKRTAKLNESSALYKKADQLDVEAAKLDGKPDPFGDVAKQREKYASEARDLRVKGDASRAEGESIPEAKSTGKYSGKRIPRASLAEAAKRLGLKSAEEAEAMLTGEGAVVY